MKPKRFFIICIAILITVIAFCRFLVYPALEHQNNAMLRDMRDVLVPPITMFGTEYRIENGGIYRHGERANNIESIFVLRLARYAMLARIDPIMGIEGTDPERLTKGVSALEESLGDFTSFYEPHEEQIIREKLYPVDFLYNLADTEEKRLALTTHPDFSLAIKYHRSLKKLIGERKKYIESMLSFYEELEHDPSVQHNQFNFLEGSLDLLTRQKIFEETLTNNELLERETEDRLHCLWRDSALCSAEAAYDRVSEYSLGAPEQERSPSLEQLVLENGELVAPDYFDSFDDQEDTPIYVLEESPCFADVSPFYSVRQFDLMNQTHAFKILFLNDLYFYNTEDFPEGPMRFENENGIKYAFQPLSNSYMCPDLIYDLTEILTLDTIRKHLLGSPISPEAKSLSPEIAELEKKITADSIVYKEDFAKLLMILADMNSDMLTYSDRKFLEDALTVSYQRSSRIDEILSGLSVENIIMKEIKKRETRPGFSLAPLFFTRNNAGFALLTFNRSVEREVLPLVKEGSRFNSFSSFRIRSYRDDLVDEVDFSELQEQVRKHANIYNDCRELCDVGDAPIDR